MSRGLDASNLTEIAATYYEPVSLIKFEFDTPVYVHNRLGTISYDGNDYLGVGDYGEIEPIRESERLGPHPIRMKLSGLDATLLAEALDAGTFGDAVTCYEGYLDTDGALVSDPWLAGSGTFDHASIKTGKDASIIITVQNDLAVLDQTNGERFSDEAQRRIDPDDKFFEFVNLTVGQRIPWGGGDGASSGTVPTPGGRSRGGLRIK